LFIDRFYWVTPAGTVAGTAEGSAAAVLRMETLNPKSYTLYPKP